MKFVVGEIGRNLVKKPTQTLFRPPRNPHGGIETRTRDPSGGRRAPNRLRHEAATCFIYYMNFVSLHNMFNKVFSKISTSTPSLGKFSLSYLQWKVIYVMK